jgi:hypothetical protein
METKTRAKQIRIFDPLPKNSEDEVHEIGPCFSSTQSHENSPSFLAVKHPFARKEMLSGEFLSAKWAQTGGRLEGTPARHVS